MAATAPGPSEQRRVSFLGKCQVIPPQQFLPDDPVDNYFARQSTGHKEHRRRGSRINLPFRSKKSRRWSSASTEDEHQHASQPMASPPSGTPARSDSAPIRASSYSPSLPIMRDGQASKLRQKLISPPPPEQENPMSPVSPSDDSPATQLPSSASDKTDSPERAPLQPSPTTFSQALPLARPVAVRKPLTFGLDKEDEEAIATSLPPPPKLSVPPIVYASSISKHLTSEAASSSKETTPPVLNWEGDRDLSSSSEDDDDDDGGDRDNCEVFDEEELHGDCTCSDCEEKMIAALSPSYAPHWTRGARRKYLADRKETLHEESRKAVRPPIWLRREDSEAAAASKQIRDICADEVDAKMGVSQKEQVPKKIGDGSNALVAAAGVLQGDDGDLHREVDEEVRLREEEARLKKTRNEMRRLSGDVGSGLRVGGGGGMGARAMMRQLEEAEQAERRARIERSRSPRDLLADQDKDEPRLMGAVTDLPSKPFTPPPRITSPVVDLKKASIPSPGNGDKASRTPSPVLKRLSATMSPKKESSPPLSAATSSNGKTEKSETPGRHPSPSLLIRRELSLGIPVQSNTLNTARSRGTWHGTSMAAAAEQQGDSATPPLIDRTPSPVRLTSPDGALSKLTDIAEVPVSNAGSTGRRPSAKTDKSRAAMPFTNMTRSNSLDALQSALNRGAEGSKEATKSSSKPPALGTPTPSLRRNNTTGSSRRPAADGGAHRGNPSAYASNGNPRPAFHTTPSTPVHFVEARIDKARARARSSFKDLVARIKS